MTGKRRLLISVAAVLALALALLSVVWKQSTGVRLDAEITRLQSVHAADRADLVRIADEVRRLESRGRIVRFARDSLGMRMPRDNEVILLPVSSTSDASEAGW